MRVAFIDPQLPSAATAGARPQAFHAVFTACAGWYDRLARFASLGLDGRWRRECLSACDLDSGHAVLDVATGTGELAIQARQAVGPRGVTVGLDVCHAMLDVASKKLARANGTTVGWVRGLAEALPFRSESFDRVTVGFGLRHMSDLSATLREVTRVLRPGGRFVVIECTRPERTFARFLLLGYLRRVVPPVVGVISRDPRVATLARYLPQTIADFVSGEALGRRLGTSGLTVITTEHHLLGLVSLYVGVKAAAPAGPAGPQTDEPTGDRPALHARAPQGWALPATEGP